jgi:uroporphyrinogen-III synthase
VEVLDLVVYDNSLRQDLDLPRADFLLFTSPLNLEASLAKSRLTRSQAVIAIGHTTGYALEKAGVPRFRVADHPSEAGMLRTLQSLVEKDSS